MKEKLTRSVGTIGLSANIMNIIIGAGIFALPAVIAAKMGSSSIIAYLFCGILVLLIALCYAEIGSKVTKTGGSYTYIETAFGAYPGFLAGLFSIGTTLFADAAVSNALINILPVIDPVFGEQWLRLLILFFLFMGLAVINSAGIRQGMWLIKFNTVAKLIPLILLITIGWTAVQSKNLVIEALPGIEQLGATALILFFAFQGCEMGLVVGGEIKNPKRTVPRAIFISIFSVLVLYILIQTVAQGVLGDDLVNFKEVPLAETARVIFGPIGYAILIAGAGVSMFGYMSGSILNSPRVLYALARDKAIVSKGLERIHPRFATPHVAILLYAFLGFIIAATGSFEQLAVIASSSLLFIYFGVALSVLKLRSKQPKKAEEFQIAGGYIVPVLSMLIILYFLSHMTRPEMIGTGIFAASASILYLLFKQMKKK
ncbi:APC family permease [Gangjinia marincola]|uniref:APC family permease n=1 Tax=Gangjinia marincola TaxID=578463 RepID=A0ABN1MFM2_9FLAO